MHRYLIGTGYAYQKKYGYRTQPGRIPSEGVVQVGQSIRLPTTKKELNKTRNKTQYFGLCLLALSLREIAERES